VQNRIVLFVLVAQGAAAAGCGGPAPTRTGDAGQDAFVAMADTGTDDAGAVDGGRDAGAVDAFAPVDANADAFVPGGGTITLSESCPDFVPCGGSIVGTWQYDSICIEHSEILGAFPAICATGTVIESGGGTVTGMVTATATSVTRTIDTSTDATILINATCSALGCASIQSMVESMVPGATAMCTEAGTTPERCRCMITFTTTIDDTQDYTITGNTMTTADGRTFDLCVDATGGTLQYRETGDSPEPGVSTSTMVD
jgi:hypothetical protein